MSARPPIGGIGLAALYRIGELAREAGVNPRTVDFYTRIGLLEPESCTQAHYRLYSEASLQRLRTIAELRKRRYSLEQIRTALGRSADDLVARAAQLQSELDQLTRSVQEMKGAPLDAKARATLTGLALKGLSLSHSLLLTLDESKHLL